MKWDEEKSWRRQSIISFFESHKDKNCDKKIKYNEEDKTFTVDTEEGEKILRSGQYLCIHEDGKIFVRTSDQMIMLYHSLSDNWRIEEKYINESIESGSRFLKLHKAILALLPKNFEKTLALRDNERVIVAGGFFRSYFSHEEPHDLDLFFSSCSMLDRVQDLFDMDPDWKLECSTENCYNYINVKTKFEVDLVRSITGDPISILDKFDFTVTKFGIAYRSGCYPKVWYHKSFFEDLNFKILNYDFDEDEGPSFSGVKQFGRAVKYYQYGYKFSRKGLRQYISLIKSVEIDDVIAYEEGDESYLFYDKNDENFDESDEVKDLPF